jgi:hypothetical protein
MQYNELSDEAKERAFNDFKNREIYDNHWAHHVLEDWVERLEDVGIDTEVYDIHWSGFHSQGDGASFEGSINLKEFLEAHPDLKARHSALYMSTVPFDTLSDDYAEYMVLLRKTQHHSYYHENTITLEWDIETNDVVGKFDKVMTNAEPDILKTCREHMRSLYNDLQNAYEHEIGLDSFLEMVDYQDFNEDGSLS